MAQIAENFLRSGFKFAGHEKLLLFRFAFFNASIAFIAFVLTCFAFYRFSIQHYVIGSIDLAYSLTLLAAIILLRGNKALYHLIANFVIALTFIALVAVTLLSSEQNVLSWYILFVIIAFIMGGANTGIAAYVTSSISLLLAGFYLTEVYELKSVITLISINSIVTFMVYQYDRGVHIGYLRLEEVNLDVLNREHETLRVIGKLSEFKDAETAAHISRVAEYSRLLAEAHGLDDEQLDIVAFSAPFHDIGKIGIPDKLLLKTGRLDDDEFEVIKTHTTIGSDILRDSESKYLRAGAIIAESHHEKWDGTGYPRGLAGEEIPILGRIVAIADVFDALTSTRPYKEAWSFAEAMDYIVEQSGIQFDPRLASLFKGHESRVRNIYQNYMPQEGQGTALNEAV